MHGRPEGGSVIPDMALEHFGLDVGFRPKGLQQLILGDQPPGMLHQVTEHREGFWSQ